MITNEEIEKDLLEMLKAYKEVKLALNNLHEKIVTVHANYSFSKMDKEISDRIVQL